MPEWISIPRIDGEIEFNPNRLDHAGWCYSRTIYGKLGKPLIRCFCGIWSGTSDYSICEDGRIMNLFEHDNCCGRHTYFKLEGWNGGEMPKG